MARHLAPFSWRQRMAEMVRRRSFGCVLPLGRHASTNGSKFVHCASDTIALSSFQKEQNARHHKQFKREQALADWQVRRDHHAKKSEERMRESQAQLAAWDYQRRAHDTAQQQARAEYEHKIQTDP